MAIAEVGGPAMNAGASYQGAVAAVWLARLLRPPSDFSATVVEVQFEARLPIDDVRVTFATGEQRHVQAKRRVTSSSEAAVAFWRSAAETVRRDDLRGAMIELAVGDDDDRWDPLRTALVRAREARTASDAIAGWIGVVGEEVARIRRAIADADDIFIWRLLKRVELCSASEDTLVFRCEQALPESSVSTTVLAAVLARIAIEGAGVRRSFTAPALAQRLKEEHQIIIERTTAGVAGYLGIVSSLYADVGLSDYISTRAEATFVWPTLCRPTSVAPRDVFLDDDDVLEGETAEHANSLLKQEGVHTVIVAGAGFGKTTLLRALARESVAGSRVPFLVSLPALAGDHDHSIIEFIESSAKAALSVDVPWKTLALRGELALLFDGLDEVAARSRESVLSRLRSFSSSFPKTPWVMTVRDPAAVPSGLGAEQRHIRRIRAEERQSYYSFYVGTVQATRIVAALDQSPALDRLCSVPLFATLLAGRVSQRGIDAMPSGPCDLLDAFVEYQLEPGRSRVHVEFSLTPGVLRTHAATLAYDGISNDRHRWRLQLARTALAGGQVSDTAIDELVRSGLLVRSGTDVAFSLPTVQEYLAGDRLASIGGAAVAKAVIAQASRPWGQAAQFALALLSDASPTMEEVLEERDDAFGTQVRALARAISWGASVDSTTRRKVGDALAAFWRSGRSRWTSFQDEAAELISAAFHDPLPDVVQKYLRARGLQYGSGSTFACATRDDDLIMEALEPTLADRHVIFRHDLLRRLMSVGPAVVDRIVAAHRTSPDPETAWQLARILADMARDEKLRPSIEAAVSSGAIGEHGAIVVRVALGRGDELAEELEVGLRSGERPYALEDCFWNLGDARQRWARLVVDDSLDPRIRRHLLFAVFESIPDGAPGMLDIALEAAQSDMIRAEILATQSCKANSEAFLALTEMLPKLPCDGIRMWCVCTGVHSGPEVARGLAAISSRELDVEELRALGQVLTFSMNYRTEPASLDGDGSGIECRPHPARAEAAKLAARLMEAADASSGATLDDVRAAVELGELNAIPRLAKLIEQLWAEQQGALDDPSGLRFAHAVNAIPPGHLDHAVIEDIIVHGTWNVARAVLNQLAPDSRADLDGLIRMAERRQAYHQDALLHEVIRATALKQRRRVFERDGLLSTD